LQAQAVLQLVLEEKEEFFALALFVWAVV